MSLNPTTARSDGSVFSGSCELYGSEQGASAMIEVGTSASGHVNCLEMAAQEPDSSTRSRTRIAEHQRQEILRLYTDRFCELEIALTLNLKPTAVQNVIGTALRNRTLAQVEPKRILLSAKGLPVELRRQLGLPDSALVRVTREASTTETPRLVLEQCTQFGELGGTREE